MCYILLLFCKKWYYITDYISNTLPPTLNCSIHNYQPDVSLLINLFVLPLLDFVLFLPSLTTTASSSSLELSVVDESLTTMDNIKQVSMHIIEYNSIWDHKGLGIIPKPVLAIPSWNLGHVQKCLQCNLRYKIKHTHTLHTRKNTPHTHTHAHKHTCT